MKKDKKSIHDLILERFGENKTKDEVFSKTKYWDKVLSNQDEVNEFQTANPDTVSDTRSLWPEVDDKDIKTVRLEFISKNIKLLSKKEKKVLELTINGSSLDQISLSLGVTKGSIQVYLNRARKKLLNAWNQND